MQLRTQFGVSVTVLLILIATASAQDWRRPESRDRGKEFVGFIQSDHLYWRPFVLPSVQPAEFKLLSLDESKRTGTQLWADYFTDCSYQRQIEYTGKGFRNLDAKTP